jgi:hypothetical protein
MLIEARKGQECTRDIPTNERALAGVDGLATWRTSGISVYSIDRQARPRLEAGEQTGAVASDVGHIVAGPPHGTTTVAQDVVRYQVIPTPRCPVLRR